MNRIIILLFFVLANFVSNAQCSSVSVQISSQDTNFIQLYNAAFFNIPSGFANVVEWEVATFSGDIILQETTSGEFNDQSSVSFNHSIPITDSMKATIIITNEMEGIICTMNDTLFWNQSEVLPGTFIGFWDVLSGSGGMEEMITSTETIDNNSKIEIFPNPSYDHIKIKGDLDFYSFSIFNGNGQIIKAFKNVLSEEQVDISPLTAGLYFIHFWDKNKKKLGIKKIVKM